MKIRFFQNLRSDGILSSGCSVRPLCRIYMEAEEGIPAQEEVTHFAMNVVSATVGYMLNVSSDCSGNNKI